MWDDEDGYVLIDPTLLDDDKGLFRSTHICPMNGGYCFPSCAWALIPIDPGEKDRWVCGKAMRYANEDYLAQGVKWDYS